MDLGSCFAKLFMMFNTVTVTLWLVGLALLVLEFYQPTRKICALCGTLCLCASLAILAIQSTNIGVCFAFVFLTLILLFVVHLVMLVLQKGRWLIAAAGKNTGSHTKNYVSLVNREGVATTEINPTGHIAVGDTNLFVMCEQVVAAGEAVKIVRVTDDKIYVVPASDVIADNPNE